MPYWGLVTIFAILLLPGLAGAVIPILPGIPFMFAVALIFAIFDKFRHITMSEFIVLGVIAILSILVDYGSGLYGAKYSGASKISLLAGILGLILGIYWFPPFGGIVGLFLGILISEIALYKDHLKALKAATGSFIGGVLGMTLNFILSVTFIILFIIFALK